MLDGVEGGAGDTGGIGKLLLQNAQLSAARGELRAKIKQRRIIASRLALFVARTV